MMRAISCLTLMMVMPLVRALDLATDVAEWGPNASGTGSVADGIYFVDALTTSTVGNRLDGLIVVDRHIGVDVQVIGGFMYDDAKPLQEYSEQYNWGRFYLRGGTDPLANRASSPFGAIGGAMCFPLYASCQGEVGYSSDRGTLASGEFCLLFLRIRFEHDDRVDTFCFGTGPRILGSTGPEAFGVLLDYARSHVTIPYSSKQVEGVIASAFYIWRPYNHLLLSAEAQVAGNAVDIGNPYGTARTAAELTLSVGSTF